jgi:AhpD family alkylhydroperoxidase
MSAAPHARVARQEYKQLAPEVNAALLQLGGVAAEHGLDKRLLELLKLRVSQINGCAFCVSYHVAEAQRLGIAANKLHTVVAWHETPLFDARERAALGWAEALTLITQGVPDSVYEQARAVFSDQELAYLTGEVLAINAWNRLAIGYRFTPLPIPAAPHVKGEAA